MRENVRPAESTQRARIVLLIDSLGLGGAERLLTTCVERLDTTCFEPRVCALQVREGNPIADEIRRLGVPVDLIGLQRLREPLGLPRIIRYLRQQNANLLHTQLEFSNTLGSIAAAVLSIPTVSTLHTLDEPLKSTRAFWRLKLMWWSLRHFCDRVIAVSEGTRQHHIRMGNLAPGKVVTIYNGVDLSRFPLHDEASYLERRQTFGVPPGAPLLITVAVLRPAKGIQHSIEALPTILEAVPETRYLVVGGGEYESHLKELAKRHGVADRVIFAGVRNDVPDLLAASDLFVLPTLDEALPTVLAEAMAAQKPIVASRVGGVPEMITDGGNGLLVPPANPSSLAEACLRFLQTPDQARRMALTGRKVVEQRFNINQQVESLSNLYQELLAKRGKWKSQ